MIALPSSKPLPSAPNRALQACLDGIAGLDLERRAGTVLLAVSGGADSMAMAVAFKEWQRRLAPSIRIKALVIDHGLRPGSGDEAGTVRGWLEGLGIDAAIGSIEGARPDSGIQAWARRHRYRLLVQSAATDDAAIATAHHAGDQAETVLMRSLRGSGVAGLAGMSRESFVDGVRLCRPFLDLQPETLHAALWEAGVPSIADPSNHDRRFERVRLRQQLSESGMGVQMRRLARSARRLNDALLAGIGEAMASTGEISPMGYVRFGHAAFAALPGTAAEAFLALVVRAMACAAHPAGHAGLAGLADALRRGRESTLGGCEWRLTGAGGARQVVCLAEAERLPEATTPAGGFCLHDRRWQVFLPEGFRGRVEAIGAERYAALKRLHRAWEPPRGVPARAFWRLPVLVAGSGGVPESLGRNAQALDDSTFVPHVVVYGEGRGPASGPQPSMRFAGARCDLRKAGF